MFKNCGTKSYRLLDPGHAIAFTTSGSKTNLFSFGPLSAPKAVHPVGGEFRVFSLQLTPSQYTSATNAISAFNLRPPPFSRKYTCTTALRELAYSIGLTNFPSGVGLVNFPSGLTLRTETPLGLFTGMTNSFGTNFTTQIFGTSSFGP